MGVGGWGLVAAAALALAACSGNAPKVKQAEVPSGPPATVDEVNGGTVTGKVSFTGEKPKRVELDMSANPTCARVHSKTPAYSEVVVVNENGTLRNAFVWVKAGLPNATWTPPASAAVLEQDGCVYLPHVIGAMVGQKLEIRNSDLTNHNVHSLAEANESWNISQPPKGDSLIKTFTRQEVMIPMKCNVHPWMKAYVGVVSHPFFAVTGDDGSFTIRGLPPGTYTIEAWHETYGRQTQQVTVGPKESKSVEFTFRG
jgi:plastocyanin